MNPANIDNGLFVGGLSITSKLTTASMVSLTKRSSKPSQFGGESAARAPQPLFGEAKVHKSRIFNGVKKQLAAGNSDPQRRRRIFFQ
jgi:hypothetical protein